MTARFTRIRRALGAVVAVATASACLPAARPWPTQSYRVDCPIVFMPTEPICLTSASFEGGFKYGDQFQACRIDLQSFGYALDRWVECVGREWVDGFNRYVDLSKATLLCLSRELPEDEFRSAVEPPACPEVEVDIDPNHNLTGFTLQPLCLRQARFFPKNRWDLERCSTEVVDYLSTMRSSIGSGRTGIHYKAQSASDRAVERFNCYARRERFCF